MRSTLDVAPLDMSRSHSRILSSAEPISLELTQTEETYNQTTGSSPGTDC